jgi:hypothetical protein
MKLALAAAGSMLALMLSGCFSGTEGELPPLEGPDGSQEGQGELLHTEQLGDVRVEFWDTPSGPVAVAMGSLDTAAASADLRELLQKPSAVEAFQALRERATGRTTAAPEALLQAEERARARVASATQEEWRAYRAAHASAAAEDTLAGMSDPAGGPLAKPQGARTNAQSVTATAVDWTADDQWFRDNFCVGAVDCLVGYLWVHGGKKSHFTSHTHTFFNHSSTSVADIGVRFARWINGTWSWSLQLHQNLPARNWLTAVYYGGVGPVLRQGWVSGVVVNNLTSQDLLFTSTQLGPEPRVSYAQRWTEFEMKGYLTTSFGSSVNRCATNVVSSFNAVPSSPTGHVRYKSQGGNVLPPFSSRLAEFGSWDDHIQSITRLPGVGDNRWAAVTRSKPSSVGGAGVFLINLGDTGGTDGTRWVTSGADYTGEPPALRGTQHYYPLSGTAHPGGLQASGRYVAIASEAPTGQTSFIDFFNFGTPGSSSAFLQRFLLSGNQAEAVVPARVISGVALTKLKDSRYLIFVLGKDSDRNGWLYVSDSTTLSSSTFWSYLDYVSAADSSFSGTFRPYQNVSFITECGTGDVYLVATNNNDFQGPVDSGQDYADLFKVTWTPSESAVKLTLMSARNMHEGSGGYCTFRAAANIHVDKNGKLILYCHAHHSNTDLFGNPDSKLKLAEYAQP